MRYTSLGRTGLQVSRLYQMHHIERITEIWQAMDTLVQQGKVT